MGTDFQSPPTEMRKEIDRNFDAKPSGFGFHDAEGEAAKSASTDFQNPLTFFIGSDGESDDEMNATIDKILMLQRSMAEKMEDMCTEAHEMIKEDPFPLGQLAKIVESESESYLGG